MVVFDRRDFLDGFRQFVPLAHGLDYHNPGLLQDCTALQLGMKDPEVLGGDRFRVPTVSVCGMKKAGYPAPSYAVGRR
jgi:hypothetical protein